MKRLRARLERVLRAGAEPAIAFLTARRVHPNLISMVGFLVTCAAGYFFHLGRVRTAGFLLLLGGVLDVVDGTVARRTGLASAFGAFYDSTLDRLSEIVVHVGLISYFLGAQRPDADGFGMVYAVVLALAGSLMISYTRARAEGLRVPCDVGMMQRAERVVLLGFAALLFGQAAFAGMDAFVLKAVIVLLAFLTHVTVVQRIWWVYRHTPPRIPTEADRPADESAPRVAAGEERSAESFNRVELDR